MKKYFEEINNSCKELNINILPEDGWVDVDALYLTYLDRFSSLDMLPKTIDFSSASAIHCYIYKDGSNCNNCPYALTNHKCVDDDGDYLTEIDDTIFNILDNTPLEQQAAVWEKFRTVYLNATIELLNIYIDGLDGYPTISLEAGNYNIDGMFNLGKDVVFELGTGSTTGRMEDNTLVLTVDSDTYVISDFIERLPMHGVEQIPVYME